MATYIATILNAQGSASIARSIIWSSFSSGANSVVFNVKAKDASKMLILVGSNSTLINSYWIGTSDSRSSGAKDPSAAYPYSASKLGRMQIKTTIAAKGALRSRFRTTVAADTEVYCVFALGPFETARFKDSDGYINVTRGKLTAGLASHSSDMHYIAAILIP
jgi:hypothetical protein